MVEWIGQWLREIIIVVLLAVFVDLLLPNQSMKRYVKVVLSLFILIAIISPLAALFKANLDFTQWQDEIAIEQSGQSGPSLQTVLETGAAIRANNARHAQQYVESNLAAQMTRELEQVMPGQISHVSVETEVDDEEIINIKRVNVMVHSPTVRDAAYEREPDGLFSIEPIEPVVINIEIEHINEEHVPASSGVYADQHLQSTTHAHDELFASIANILRQQWHVSSEQLVVRYADEVSTIDERRWGHG